MSKGGNKSSACIEGLHSSYYMCGMLPLRSLGYTGAPSVDDLPERPIDGEGERTLHKATSSWLGDQGGGELLEDGLKMSTSKS